MAKNIKVFLELDTSKFDRNLAKSESSVKTMKGSADKLGVGLKTLAGIGATAFAFKGIVQTTARFEDLRTTLTSVTGSVENGAKAFENIQNFATKTQFGVEELTNTYIKLKTAGIEPTEKLLTTFTDTAANTTDQLGSLEAMTDLLSRTVSGGLGLEELNRLADRGVPVFRILEQQLGLTRLQVSEFGKTADGAQKITDALIKGLNSEFGGSTEKRLQNLSVAMSNFDIATKQAQDVFGQGFAPALGDATNSLTRFIEENQQLIRDLGEGLGRALQFTIDNLDVIIPLVGAFAAGIAAIKIVNLIKDIGAATKALMAFNTVMRANPVLLAITAISAAVLLLINHWDTVKYAAEEFARLAQLGMVKLARVLLDTLGSAIQSIIDLFQDLKAVGSAVAAGLAAALTDPLNATEAFKTAFTETMDEIERGRDQAVKPFQGAIDELKKKEEELSVATQRVTTETEALTDATQDATTATEQLTENSQSNKEAADDLNDAVQTYIQKLRDTEVQTEKTARERELEKEIMEAQKKAAEELGVTVSKLSAEQLDAIAEVVTAKYEEKEAIEETAAADKKAKEEAIASEKKKRDEIQRTLELTDEYYIEAIAGAENYRKQLEMEGEQIRELTGLYGTERDVAEELFEFRSKAAEDIAKLEAAEQDLREKGATKEADQVAQKIANLKEALKEEETAIKAAAKANSEYQRSFEYGWREAYARFSDDATNTAKQAAKVFDTFATGMSDALYNFAMTGKLSFKDLVDSMKSTIARFLADRITQKFLEFLDSAIFGNKSSSSGGGGSGIGFYSAPGSGGGRPGSSGGGLVGKAVDFVKGLFGFEGGGYIPGNKMSIVGEGGPEIFMPSSSGTIIPNFAAGGMVGGGGVTNVTYNISAVDARSFRQLVAQDPEFIYNVTLAGSRRVPQ